jgi:hypothetical protein
MLHKCANPACLTAFRNLGHGKLFQIESKTLIPGAEASSERRLRNPRRGGNVRRVERYWLCGECSAFLTLAPEKLGGVSAAPLPALGRRALPLSQAARAGN